MSIRRFREGLEAGVFWLRSRRVVGCVFAVLLACAAEAPAVVVTGSVSGSISEILETGTACAPDCVTVGDSVTVQFAYESTAIAESPNSWRATYGVDVNLELTAEIDGLVWQVITPGFDPTLPPIRIDNDRPAGIPIGDELCMSSATFIGGHVGSSFPTDFGGYCELGILLRDEVAPYDFLSSVALPNSQEDWNPAAITLARGGITSDSYVNGEQSACGIYFDLDPSTLQLHPVPEPSTLVMALLGLMGVGLCWRRRWN